MSAAPQKYDILPWYIQIITKGCWNVKSVAQQSRRSWPAALRVYFLSPFFPLDWELPRWPLGFFF
jgi:hypothetical protein